MNNVELYVNGVQVDVPKGFSLRMNRVVSDPSRINGGSAEYSYQFSLPETPVNDNVFGFANALPVHGKFMRRYAASVYARGRKVFDGDLTLTSYDAVDREYTCNLVSIKVNTVDDIFGDMTLHDLEWYIPYEGAPTINSLNANASSEVCFPLVAYGLFEKDPVYSDEVADDYTDRLLLDDSVRWYHETFYPSLNVLALVRRLFEQKGYTLQGDVLDDEVMKNIYCSVSLATDQPLEYNLASSKMGNADISVSWTNKKSASELYDGVIRDLKYKYCHVTPDGGQAILDNYHGTPPMQWEEIDVYNMFADGAQVTENIDSYLFDSGEKCVVIPADGCYRFDLEVTATLDTTWNSGRVNVARKVMTFSNYPTIETENVNLTQDINYVCPIEVQLTRNTLNDDGDLELIKGPHNRDWVGSSTSVSDYDTCYPHEMLYDAKNPTNVDPIYNITGENIYDRTIGYLPASDSVFAFDPNVSRDFICGFSTYLGGTAAVTKNNRSWYRGLKDYTQSMYVSGGYELVKANTYYVTQRIPSPMNINTYPDAPQCSVSLSGNTLTGHIYCAVWLNKNDVLTLNCVHRHWDGYQSGYGNRYVTNVTARLKMDSFTPRDYSYVISRNMGYDSQSQFDSDLRLGNFLSRERGAADFVNNFIKEFNLDYRQSGKTVELNRSKMDVSSAGKAVVDIDGRCSAKRSKWKKADYPRECGVRYSDEKDSWGYWNTVPEDKQNEYNWKEFGDTGYDLITVDPDSTSTNVVSSQTGMTYYDTFTLQQNQLETALTIPVIGDYEVFAPGANYGEFMQNDCLDKKMRYWFRQNNPTGKSVQLASTSETVNLYLPTNFYNGVEMNFKDRRGSLLRRYFNIGIDIRNEEVDVDVRLTPDEFVLLSNGANVKFDDSLWRVLEINGFDPSGRNETTLSLTRL